MKRFLALTFAMVLTLSMAACANEQATPPASSGSENGSATQQPSDTNQMQNDTTQQNSTAATAKTGVGIVVSLENSYGAAEGKPARAQAEVTVCAAAFDKDGKIVSVRFDAVEPGVDFDTTGALTSDLTQAVETKRQLGDEYGMKEASGIGKEWYQQVDALEQWMTGRTVEEVMGMKTTTQNGAEYADEADLASSATIAVDDFMEALQAAYDDAQGTRTEGSSDTTTENGNSADNQQSSSSSASSAS